VTRGKSSTLINGTLAGVEAAGWFTNGASSCGQGSSAPGSELHGATIEGADPWDAADTPVTDAGAAGAAAGALCSSDRSALAPQARTACIVVAASLRANTAPSAPSATPTANHRARCDMGRRMERVSTALRGTAGMRAVSS
jgi:hypothetical protein